MMRKWRPTVLALLLALSFSSIPLTIDSANAEFPADTGAYWGLDDAQQAAPGAYVEEIIPANGVCAAGGCPTFAGSPAGQVNNSQTFVGTDDSDGIDVAANAAFDWAGDASFSIALWINRDVSAVQLGQNEVAIGRDDTFGGGPLHWWVGISNVGAGADINVATFVLSDDGSIPGPNSAQGVVGTADIADGTWHYLVAVKDEVAGELRLYVDSVLVDTEAIGQLFYATGFASLEPLNIGYMDFQNTSKFHFVGSIDEVALFDTALTQTEIDDNYALGQAGTSLRAAVAPLAADNSYVTFVNTTFNQSAPGVLGNDSPGTTAILVDDVTDGALTLNANGSFTYTPNPGFVGTDTFTYKANDGVTDSTVATVTIDVMAGNPFAPIFWGGGGGGGCFISIASFESIIK
jgi:hypothetical protein